MYPTSDLETFYRNSKSDSNHFSGICRGGSVSDTVSYWTVSYVRSCAYMACSRLNIWGKLTRDIEDISAYIFTQTAMTVRKAHKQNSELVPLTFYSNNTWPSHCLKSSATRMFVERLVQATAEKNVKATCMHHQSVEEIAAMDSPHRSSIMRGGFPYTTS